MSTRGVKRYLSCLDYLEAKYSDAIDDEEYNRRKSVYESYNTVAAQHPSEIAGQAEAEPDNPEEEDIEDETETESDDDSVGSIAEFIDDDEDEEN